MVIIKLVLEREREREECKIEEKINLEKDNLSLRKKF